MAAADKPAGIVVWPSPYDPFKLAKVAVGASTASVIRYETALLAAELEQARAVYVRTWSVRGSKPDAREIMRQFPKIRELCVEADIYKYIADQGIRTQLSAAIEIMHGLFPRYSSQSIARMARAPRRSRAVAKTAH
jgi:hypothetical protein